MLLNYKLMNRAVLHPHGLKVCNSVFLKINEFGETNMSLFGWSVYLQRKILG